MYPVTKPTSCSQLFSSWRNSWRRGTGRIRQQRVPCFIQGRHEQILSDEWVTQGKNKDHIQKHFDIEVDKLGTVFFLRWFQFSLVASAKISTMNGRLMVSCRVTHFYSGRFRENRTCSVLFLTHQMNLSAVNGGNLSL